MGDDEVRRLRERSAREILGWTPGAVPWASGEPVPVWHRPDGVPVMPCPAWAPDADERHCARLIETLLARGWRLELWRVARFGRSGGAAPPPSEAPGRRLAIVRAALAAEALPPGVDALGQGPSGRGGAEDG